MRWIRYLAGPVIVIALLGGAVAGAIYFVTGQWLRETYQIAVSAIEIPSDAETISEGRRLAATRGCVDCHGPDLGGKVIVDDPIFGLVSGSNLTPGGVATRYDDAAWQRAVRHGVGVHGRALFLMPSHEYFFLSDADLGPIIAYVKSVPPADHGVPPVSLGPVGRLLLFLGEIKLAAREIDHTAVRPPAPTPGATVDYGGYLAIGCTGCHGADFSGGPIPGAPPDWPPASNITPSQSEGIGAWSRDDFETAMRTGIRADGTAINAVMPWEQFSLLTDDEMQALWLYFRSVPPISGNGN